MEIMLESKSRQVLFLFNFFGNPFDYNMIVLVILFFYSFLFLYSRDYIFFSMVIFLFPKLSTLHYPHTKHCYLPYLFTVT